MADNFLSQAEIDALLNQASGGSGIGKSMKAVAEKIAEILSQFTNMSVTTDKLEPQDSNRVQLVPALSGLVLIPLQFTPSGLCVVAVDEELAAKIAAVAMGQDGSDAISIDEMGLSVIQEAFSQVAGGIATVAAKQAGSKVSVGPASPQLFDGDDQLFNEDFAGSELASAKTSLNIEGLGAGELWIVVDDEFEGLWGEATKEVAAAAVATPITPAPAPMAYVPPTPKASAPLPSGRPDVNIKKAVFEPLDKFDSGQFQNINLLMDVPLEITVELGRTKMQIKEILELGKGSLIELSKLAGEPVDIMVNGKLLAKGEVVVIDETFGVKIVDIVSPVERVNNLQ